MAREKRSESKSQQASRLSKFSYERALYFFDGQILMHSLDHGREQHKFLSADSVMAALKDAPVDSGWIPEGVLRHGTTKRGNFVALVIKSGSQTINVLSNRGMKRISVHLPAFFWFGYDRQWKVWAMKTDAPTPETELFVAPLPNTNEGNICWGNNTVPAASVQTAKEAWQLFLDAPFNGDSAGNKSKRYRIDVRDQLFDLAKTKKKFPLGDLMTLNSYGKRTIAAILEANLGGTE